MGSLVCSFRRSLRQSIFDQQVLSTYYYGQGTGDTKVNQMGVGSASEHQHTGTREARGADQPRRPEKCSLAWWWLNSLVRQAWPSRHRCYSLFIPSAIFSVVFVTTLPRAYWLSYLLQKQSCFYLEASATAMPCACSVSPQITEDFALGLHPGFCRSSVTSPEELSLAILSASLCFLWFPFSPEHFITRWHKALCLCIYLSSVSPSGLRAPTGRAVSSPLMAVPSPETSAWTIRLDKRTVKACCVPVPMLPLSQETLSGLQEPIRSPKRKHANHERDSSSTDKRK